MKTVLVTGGAGYIGSHTCKALARAGYEPVTYDNLSMGHRHNVKWGPLVEGDVGDRAQLESVLRQHKVEAVLHFAGNGYVGESNEQPDKYFRNNAANSLNLLETMRHSKVTRLVFSSSCSTYGIPQTVPIPAAHPQNPINPYGQSKLMTEWMIREFGRAFGLHYSILRYFNAAGADPEGELKEEHEPEYHLIPLVVNAAFGQREPVSVFGSDYPTPDGTCIRDYVHVTDLAHAHTEALRRLESGMSADVRNLGTGRGTSVKQVIQAVENATGRAVPVNHRERRPGDPPVLVAEADGRDLQFQTIEQIIATLL